MDDFIVRAAIGGIGVALAAGPVGCVVVWRRMAYFGAALAHSVLLGVGLGFLLDVDLTLGVLATCVALAGALALLERQRVLPVDTLLGVLAHVALAAGLIVVSALDTLRVDLMGYLFGDVLAIGRADLAWIAATATAALAALAWLWRDLLAIAVSAELAEVDGVKVQRVRAAFVLLLAAVIAVGMKIVGMLLILSLVIVPAAAARPLASTPERMAVLAAGFGAVSVIGGLWASLRLDVPAGPAIVLVLAGAFVASLALGRRAAPVAAGE